MIEMYLRHYYYIENFTSQNTIIILLRNLAAAVLLYLCILIIFVLILLFFALRIYIFLLSYRTSFTIIFFHFVKCLSHLLLFNNFSLKFQDLILDLMLFIIIQYLLLIFSFLTTYKIPLNLQVYFIISCTLHSYCSNHFKYTYLISHIHLSNFQIIFSFLDR